MSILASIISSHDVNLLNDCDSYVKMTSLSEGGGFDWGTLAQFIATVINKEKMMENRILHYLRKLSCLSASIRDSKNRQANSFGYERSIWSDSRNKNIP